MEISANLPPAAPATQRIRILHTNDVHGTISPVTDRVVMGQPTELGGSAYIASLADDARAEDPGRTLLLDAGDAVHGQVSTDLDEGKSMVEVMNEVGYDAATLGNHDFQWGVPSLLERLAKAEYPVVVGNLVGEDGAPLPGTEPRRMFDLDGVKVGMTGLVTTETVEKARPERIQGVKFMDEASALRTQVEALRAEGADVILVMSHMGLDEDKKLAAEFPGAGIVFVGGHSHDRVAEPVEVAGNYIVQAGSQGKELGEITLDVSDRKIRSVEHRLIPVDPREIEPDPEVAALVARYEDRADREMGRQLNILPERFTRSNHVDSPLGRLATDAMRAAAGADLALLNSGALRTDLEAGPLDQKGLYGVMPFNGELMVGRLKGSQILEGLEYSVSQRSTSPADETRFSQISGGRFAYDASQPPGQRILGIEIGGQPLDPDATYTVALDDYMAQGKAGYTMFKDGGWQPTGKDMVSAMAEWAPKADVSGDVAPRILDRTPL